MIVQRDQTIVQRDQAMEMRAEDFEVKNIALAKCATMVQQLRDIENLFPECAARTS